MSRLSFFPWWSLEDQLEFEGFVVTPYQRGRLPAGDGSDLQVEVDRLLGAYLYTPKIPIENAAILKLDGKHVNSDLSDDESALAYDISQIITTSALSKRELFSQFGYWNSTDLSFSSVTYTSAEDHIVHRTRRRDGERTHLVADAYSFHVDRPFNTNPNERIQLDAALLRALLTARRKSPAWPDLLDALRGFNGANTDGHEVSEQQEVVLLAGAFQRLLGGSYEESRIMKWFSKYFNSFFSLDISESKRLSGRKGLHDKYLFAAWHREFQKLRNNYAHGKSTSDGNYAWTTFEHLILGSHLFPLLLKRKLEIDGHYLPTESDELDLEIFEARADSDFLVPILSPRDNDRWPWREIKADMYIDRLSRCLAESIVARAENDLA